MSKKDCFNNLKEGDVVYLTCNADKSITDSNIVNHIGIYVVFTTYPAPLVWSRFIPGYTFFNPKSLVKIKKKKK